MVGPNGDALSLSNLLKPEMRANPYPFYAQLRSQDPVHWDSPMGFWVLTRYADVVSIYHDQRFSRADGLRENFKHMIEKDPAHGEPVYEAFSKMMTYSDPPYHTRLRGLANKAFTPRAVEKMEPHIQKIVDEMLDAVQPNGRMDIIHELAAPLPIIVISEMLGLPRDDVWRYKKWSDDVFGVFGAIRRSPELLADALKGYTELSEYIGTQIQTRHSEHKDDLLTALVVAEEEGKRLSREELVANVALLLTAGHETTTNLIGNGTLALLRNPDQLEKLRADPSLIPCVVEEVMRYDNPAQIAYRSAMEDVEVGGKKITRGQVVNLIIGGANRDPEQFRDPDRFDIERPELRHVGMGQGIHYCLGAPLARAEGQIALSTLFRRFPNLRLATEELEWYEHPTFHGLKSLPVEFS